MDLSEPNPDLLKTVPATLIRASGSSQLGVAFADSAAIFFITIACFFLIKWTSEWWRKVQLVNKFPGPNTLPIIGNGHQMLFKKTEFYDWSRGLCQRWGDPMRMWRLTLPMIFVSTYETAIQLFSSNTFVAKSQDIKLFWRQPGGNGISSSPAHVHNARRKLLYPGYTRQVVERSVPMFREESKILTDTLEKFVDTGITFEILEKLQPCSFRIMCRSTFGDKLMSEKSDYTAFQHMQALHVISNNFTNRIMSPYLWLRNDFIYFNLTTEGRQTWKFIKVINDFGMEAIRLRRQERSELLKNNPSSNYKQDGEESEGMDKKRSGVSCYLDMLLDFQESGHLQEKEILGELNNYIIAGYDTTALAVTWTLFALALNPLHQEKIVQELHSIFGDMPTSQININVTDTKKMKYLELCIKETFRMFPVSPVAPRSTTVDMILNDGRVIPAGCDVMIMVNLIHMDPIHFPEPQEFKPERHLQPNPAFLPFSTGVRSCIGQAFAMHVIKVELAYLLLNFIWETEEKPETLPRLFQGLLLPAEGIHFSIRKRER